MRANVNRQKEQARCDAGIISGEPGDEDTRPVEELVQFINGQSDPNPIAQNHSVPINIQQTQENMDLSSELSDIELTTPVIGSRYAILADGLWSSVEVGQALLQERASLSGKVSASARDGFRGYEKGNWSTEKGMSKGSGSWTESFSYPKWRSGSNSSSGTESFGYPKWRSGSNSSAGNLSIEKGSAAEIWSTDKGSLSSNLLTDKAFPSIKLLNDKGSYSSSEKGKGSSYSSYEKSNWSTEKGSSYSSEKGKWSPDKQYDSWRYGFGKMSNYEKGSAGRTGSFGYPKCGSVSNSSSWNWSTDKGSPKKWATEKGSSSGNWSTLKASMKYRPREKSSSGNWSTLKDSKKFRPSSFGSLSGSGKLALGKTRKYSRSFLLKLSVQFTALPQGFQVTADIADIMIPSINAAAPLMVGTSALPAPPDPPESH